ncbi:hypothetical protein [Ferruginibacter sp.]|nr:hypothetical protein [Ferruginibacter sp.]
MRFFYNRKIKLLFVSLSIFTCSFGQIFSKELEIRSGFKEIKLDSGVHKISCSYIGMTDTTRIFKYTGLSKFVYDAAISELFIESDVHLKITKLKIFTEKLSDEVFFSLPKKLKETFGEPNTIYKENTKTVGSIAWISKSNYLEFIYTYHERGLWNVTIVMGKLHDLSKEVQDIYLKKNDDF